LSAIDFPVAYARVRSARNEVSCAAAFMMTADTMKEMKSDDVVGPMASPAYPIGVISDTHGLLRDEALAALAGSALIIHAGDVGEPSILSRLRDIAPVLAVRGNVDKDAWARVLPLTDVIQADPHTIYVLHDLAQLDLDPRAAGLSAVISGHSHKPLIDERDGILFLNPGSAGPRRFDLPVTVARLTTEEGRLRAQILDLGRG
jgi:putative phosphoesterase